MSKPKLGASGKSAASPVQSDCAISHRMLSPWACTVFVPYKYGPGFVSSVHYSPSSGVGRRHNVPAGSRHPSNGLRREAWQSRRAQPTIYAHPSSWFLSKRRVSPGVSTQRGRLISAPGLMSSRTDGMTTPLSVCRIRSRPGYSVQRSAFIDSPQHRIRRSQSCRFRK